MNNPDTAFSESVLGTVAKFGIIAVFMALQIVLVANLIGTAEWHARKLDASLSSLAVEVRELRSTVRELEGALKRISD